MVWSQCIPDAAWNGAKLVATTSATSSSCAIAIDDARQSNSMLPPRDRQVISMVAWDLAISIKGINKQSGSTK
jgi:hypothetical protein